jgi:predicted transposase YbfD/YdcC
MPSSLIHATVRHLEQVPSIDSPADLPELSTLIQALERVPDPRGQRGTRYSLVFLLTASVVALLCGARSLLGLARWIRSADRQVLERLGLRPGARWKAPADSTLGRTWRGVDADALDDALGHWLAAILAAGQHSAAPQGPPVAGVSLDGKVMRGAAKAGTDQPHLVAAVDQATGVVLGQRAVDVKRGEITAFYSVLDTLDLSGRIVTADALHTQRDHAHYLHERGGFYLFPVKANQPRLFAALDRLDWENTPVSHTLVEQRRGRTERREVTVLPAPADLPFPHAAQVLLIERYVTGRGDGKIHASAELAVTSIPWHLAGPALLASLIRGQWVVETVHMIRDVVYREDACRVRTGQSPRVMAALRNTAISIISLMGWTGITEANDHYRDHPEHALQAIGLTTPEITQRHQFRLTS